MRSLQLLTLIVSTVVLGCGVFGCGAEGDGEVTPSETTSEEVSAKSSESTGQESGSTADAGALWTLFAEHNCAMCHGIKGEGTKMGPKLEKISENWTRAELEKYLDDPEGYANRDERLAKNLVNYEVPMPALEDISADDRKKLIDHLLGL